MSCVWNSETSDLSKSILVVAFMEVLCYIFFLISISDFDIFSENLSMTSSLGHPYQHFFSKISIRIFLLIRPLSLPFWSITGNPLWGVSLRICPSSYIVGTSAIVVNGAAMILLPVMCSWPLGIFSTRNGIFLNRTALV